MKKRDFHGDFLQGKRKQYEDSARIVGWCFVAIWLMAVIYFVTSIIIQL